MYVEAVAPFDVAVSDALSQIPIGEKPRKCSHHNAHQYKVNDDNVEDAINRMAKCKIQRIGECCRRDAYTQNEQHKKRWIVSSKLRLGF